MARSKQVLDQARADLAALAPTRFAERYRELGWTNSEMAGVMARAGVSAGKVHEVLRPQSGPASRSGLSVAARTEVADWQRRNPTGTRAQFLADVKKAHPGWSPEAASLAFAEVKSRHYDYQDAKGETRLGQADTQSAAQRREQTVQRKQGGATRLSGEAKAEVADWYRSSPGAGMEAFLADVTKAHPGWNPDDAKKAYREVGATLDRYPVRKPAPLSAVNQAMPRDRRPTLGGLGAERARQERHVGALEYAKAAGSGLQGYVSGATGLPLGGDEFGKAMGLATGAPLLMALTAGGGAALQESRLFGTAARALAGSPAGRGAVRAFGLTERMRERLGPALDHGIRPLRPFVSLADDALNLRNLPRAAAAKGLRDEVVVPAVQWISDASGYTDWANRSVDRREHPLGNALLREAPAIVASAALGQLTGPADAKNPELFTQAANIVAHPAASVRQDPVGTVSTVVGTGLGMARANWAKPVDDAIDGLRPRPRALVLMPAAPQGRPLPLALPQLRQRLSAATDSSAPVRHDLSLVPVPAATALVPAAHRPAAMIPVTQGPAPLVRLGPAAITPVRPAPLAPVDRGTASPARVRAASHRPSDASEAKGGDKRSNARKRRR